LNQGRRREIHACETVLKHVHTKQKHAWDAAGFCEGGNAPCAADPKLTNDFNAFFFQESLSVLASFTWWVLFFTFPSEMLDPETENQQTPALLIARVRRADPIITIPVLSRGTRTLKK
jgi:hypothetical protein